MKTLNTRALVEGAVLAALTAVMGIFYNLPFLNVLTLFWPVPIIIIGYRNGFRISIIASIIAALIVGLFVNPITGLILFATYAFPGAIMGVMMRKNISIYVNLLVCGVILAVACVLEFLLGLELTLGKSIIDIVWNFNTTIGSVYTQIYNQFVAATDIYKQFGFDDAEIKQVISMFDQTMEFAKLVLPSALLLTGITAAYINFKAVRLILNRVGYKIEDIKRFSLWSLRRSYKMAVLAVTFIILLLMSTKVQFLYALYSNIWILLMMLFAVLGLSVVAYYIERYSMKYEIPTPVQGLALVVVFILLMSVLPYIGMFDIAADIRRIDRNTMGGIR